MEIGGRSECTAQTYQPPQRNAVEMLLEGAHFMFSQLPVAHSLLDLHAAPTASEAAHLLVALSQYAPSTHCVLKPEHASPTALRATHLR